MSIREARSCCFLCVAAAAASPGAAPVPAGVDAPAAADAVAAARPHTEKRSREDMIPLVNQVRHPAKIN